MRTSPTLHWTRTASFNRSLDLLLPSGDSFHGFPVKGLTLTQEKSTSLRFRGGDISPVLILPKSTCLAQLSKPVAS
ncbi:hypothetical protein LB505_005266 [Fusarium chuoi]|nr:hypothetical protein LB505_005266 [Fusarium chuoi]